MFIAWSIGTLCHWSVIIISWSVCTLLIYNKLISDARASVPFLITDSCVHISKEGQVKKKHLHVQNIKYRNFICLVHSYVLYLGILAICCTPSRGDEPTRTLYYYYFIVCYLYNTTPFWPGTTLSWMCGAHSFKQRVH